MAGAFLRGNSDLLFRGLLMVFQKGLEDLAVRVICDSFQGLFGGLPAQFQHFFRLGTGMSSLSSMAK